MKKFTTKWEEFWEFNILRIKKQAARISVTAVQDLVAQHHLDNPGTGALSPVCTRQRSAGVLIA